MSSEIGRWGEEEYININTSESTMPLVVMHSGTSAFEFYKAVRRM
jgi:hypothetical protein